MTDQIDDREDDDSPALTRFFWGLIIFAVLYVGGYHFLLRWVILGT